MPYDAETAKSKRSTAETMPLSGASSLHGFFNSVSDGDEDVHVSHGAVCYLFVYGVGVLFQVIAGSRGQPFFLKLRVKLYWPDWAMISRFPARRFFRISYGIWLSAFR